MHAPLSPAFRSEWCSVAALEPIAAEWRALATRALEPNVFYDTNQMLGRADSQSCADACQLPEITLGQSST